MKIRDENREPAVIREPAKPEVALAKRLFGTRGNI